MKNWKRFLVIALATMTVGTMPLPVLAKESTLQSQSLDQGLIQLPDKKEISEDEILTFDSLWKKEQPYQVFSLFKEQDDFLKKLSNEEVYQMKILMKYALIKEMNSESRQSFDAYLKIIEEWKQREKKLKTPYTPKEIEALNKKAFTYVSNQEKQYPKDDSKDDSKEKISNFDTYTEFLQTILKFDVKECLNLLENFENANTDEELAKAKESFSDFCDQVYGFDEPSNEDEEVIDSNIDSETNTENPEEQIISKEEMQKLAYTITSIEGIELNDTGLYMEMGISGNEINTFRFDEISKFKANLGDGSQKDIEVKWVNEDIKDISKLKEGSYEFQISLPKGYTWSEDILSKFNSGEYIIPFFKLTVIERSNSSISPISNNRASVSIPRFSIIPLYENNTIEVLCYVQGSGYASVKAPTWTKSDQSDIQWYSLGKNNWVRSNKTYNYGTQIPISNHRNYMGSYTTHFYALDSNGKVLASSGLNGYYYAGAKIGNTFYEDVCVALKNAKANDVINIIRDHEMYEVFDGSLPGTVYIRAEGASRTITYCKKGRIIIKSGTLSVGSNTGYRITLDASGGIRDGDCGIICTKNGAKSIFRNCTFKNSNDLKDRWFLHFEEGFADIENCTFSDIHQGIGAINNNDTKRPSFRVVNNYFENISGKAVHYSAMHGLFSSVEISSNKFTNCFKAVDIGKYSGSTVTAKQVSTLKSNTYSNVYSGVNVTNNKTNDSMEVHVSNDVYNGYKYNGNYTKDDYDKNFPCGFRADKSVVNLTNCSYKNTQYGIVGTTSSNYTLTNVTSSNNNANLTTKGISGYIGYGAGFVQVGGGNATINNSTFNYNSANTGGGIYATGKVIIDKNSSISNNTSTYGGGIWIGNSANVILNSGTISNNTSTQDGGGVVNAGIFTTYGTISNNTSGRTGGGIRNNATLYLKGGTIKENKANGHSGGGIFSGANCKVIATGGTIEGNTAQYNGGGIILDTSNSESTFEGVTIKGNTANGSGGGIFTSATIKLTNSNVNNNKSLSSNGGGIYSNAPITLTNSNVNYNEAALHGGGLFVNNNTTINGGNIGANKAISHHGGGIYLNYKTLTLNNAASIQWNTAGGHGGGIATYADASSSSAVVNLNSGYLRNNTAGNNGGGISVGTNTILNTTGEIYSNKATNGGGISALTSTSVVNIKGGNIYSNTSNSGGGIALYEGTVNQSGGNIHSNISGSGVYIRGTYNFTGGKAFNNNSNDFYLVKDHVVNWKGHNPTYDGTKPIVCSEVRTLGTPLVKFVAGSKLGSACESYFTLKYYDNPELIGRGGNRNSSASDSLVISRTYTITYDQNATDTVTNMPGIGSKYWNESYTIASNIPTLARCKFLGWGTDKTSATFQPSGKLVASINKDTTLYAVWKLKDFTVIFDSNGGTGTMENQDIEVDVETPLNTNTFKKTGYVFNGWATSTTGSAIYTDGQSVINLANPGEFVTLYATWKPITYYVDFNGNGATSGTMMKQTLTYDKTQTLTTNSFTKTDATFIGWNTKADGTGVNYTNKQSVKNLTSINGATITLYAKWDLAPIIDFDGDDSKRTFYEGTTVKAEDLMKGIVASDAVDGNLTDKVKITKIEYAAGKLVDGKKQAAYSESYPNGMSETDTLDTWFMQLDKADSPVMHKVTYQVTDSVGNVTTKVVNVYVKYNEFPVITVREQKYRLEEAQAGIITEQRLLGDLIKSGELKATDSEEGTLSNKIELVDFNPEDFTTMVDEGFVAVKYKVTDSMGPNGIGKETIKIMNVLVHEIRPQETVKSVRFIDKKYYKKNENVNTTGMDKKEIAILAQNGGLHPYSYWYTDKAYKTLLTSTFEKESGVRYVYTKSDIGKMRDYVKANGVGNAKKDTGLDEFAAKFMTNDYKK